MLTTHHELSVVVYPITPTFSFPTDNTILFLNRRCPFGHFGSRLTFILAANKGKLIFFIKETAPSTPLSNS